MTKTYNLVLTGRILPGHSADTTAQALARILQVSDDQAQALLGPRETTVKRGLPEFQVPKYVEALQRTGAEVRAVAIEPAPAGSFPTLIESDACDMPAATAPEASAAARATPVPQPAVARTAATSADAPIAAPAATLALAAEELMSCPACGTQQPKRNLCRECGIDMPRRLAAQAEAARNAPPVAPAAVPAASPFAAPRSPLRDVASLSDEFVTPSPLGLSLDGRVGRLRYLAYAFPAYLPLVLGAVLGGLVGGFTHPGAGLVVPLALGGLITLWMGLRTMVLRLHDVNRSGKWVLAMMVVPILAAVSRSPTAFLGLAALLVIVSLLLMFLPGSMGNNEFGPPPGPNTLWTIVGAGLMLVLSVVSGFSGGFGTRHASGDAAELSEEQQPREAFRQQMEEARRQAPQDR